MKKPKKKKRYYANVYRWKYDRKFWIGMVMGKSTRKLAPLPGSVYVKTISFTL